MVSGCVGILRDFALTFGPSPVGTAAFVRNVSSVFQVVATLPDATNVLNRARPNPAQRFQDQVVRKVLVKQYAHVS